MIICPNCKSQLTDGSRFCYRCGMRLPEASSFCTNCGNPIAPGAAFCTRCGAPTAGKAVSPAPQQVEPQAVPPVEPQVAPPIEPQVISLEPQIAPPVEPQVVPPVEPQVVPPVEPQVIPPVEPQVVPPVEPQVAPPVEPQVVPPVEPQVVPPVEPQVVPPVEPQVVPPVEPQVVPPAEPQVIPPHEPQVVPPAEPQVVPPVEPQVVPPVEPQVVPAPVQPYVPAAPQTTPPAPPRKKKKTWKKVLLFGGIGLVVVLAALAAVFFFLLKPGGTPAYGLYVKDKEIFYSVLNSSEPRQITDQLDASGGVTNRDIASAAYRLAQFTQLSKDGKLIFYPDRIGDSFGLYYRDLSDPQSESRWIASDIDRYVIEENGAFLTYLRDGELCQFDTKTAGTATLGENIYSFYSSSDGKAVCFLGDDGILSLKKSGEDVQRVDSNVTSIVFVSSDFSTVYYHKDETLYKREPGKDRVKLLEDDHYIANIYDSGEIYYFAKGQLDLSDFVEDDLAASDALITRPETPKAPRWEDYEDDEDAYDEAWDEYDEAWDKYEEAYDLYLEKLDRDSIREQLAEGDLTVSRQKLYYLDSKAGGEPVELMENVVPYRYDLSYETPVIVFLASGNGSVKVPLSEATDVYDLQNRVDKASEENSVCFVAVGTKVVSAERSFSWIRAGSDGKSVFFIDREDGASYGDLYKVEIADGDVGAPAFVDSGVSTDYSPVTQNGHIIYFKDLDDQIGTLCVDGEVLEESVRTASLVVPAEEDVFYFLGDWDADKEKGTLKLTRNSQTETISDDVHAFTLLPGGGLLYLYDFSTSFESGDLYLYKGGRPEKLDEGVAVIIPTMRTGNAYNPASYY